MCCTHTNTELYFSAQTWAQPCPLSCLYLFTEEDKCPHRNRLVEKPRSPCVWSACRCLRVKGIHTYINERILCVLQTVPVALRINTHMLSAVFSNKGKADFASWVEVKEVITSKTTLQLYNFPLHYRISCLCGLTAGRTSFRCVLREEDRSEVTQAYLSVSHTQLAIQMLEHVCTTIFHCLYCTKEATVTET